ncbi:MAG: hypothetical protein IKD13_01185, partial [Firmicutes bacterium]|nr:hypothetical protein [Bacillota bacterium]
MEELKKLYIDRSDKERRGLMQIAFGILLSTILFYCWVDLELNLFSSICGTMLLFGLLFLSQKYIYLSCVIFTAITVLMFANIVFNSYYAGYLT